MTGNVARRTGEFLLGGLCRCLARTPVPAGTYSLLGAASGILAAVFLLLAHNVYALAAIVLTGMFDFLDGGVSRAKETRGHTPWRHSSLVHIASDKLGDIAIILGIAGAGLANWSLALLAILTELALTLSGQIWRRTRELDLDRSLFDRSDRLACLLVCGTFRQWTASLILVSLMNAVCLLHRAYLVRTAPPHRGSRP